MRVLTILLDPGRLKRGVGPNRELGSPLTAGRIYTLVIGAGLLDGSGRNLEAPVHKSFSVSPAIREAIVPEQWELRAPPADTRLPLALHFPAPLDWALLHSTLTVTTADGQPLKGQSNLDKGGKPMDVHTNIPVEWRSVHPCCPYGPGGRVWQQPACTV